MKTSKLTLLALATAAAVYSLGTARAAVIAGWNLSTDTTNAAATATTTDANLSSSPVLSMGPGFTAEYYAVTAGLVGFATVDTSAGLSGASGANSKGTYFEFTLTPAAGHSMQIDSIGTPLPSYYWVAQGVPATSQTINIASSLDSYGSSLGSTSPSVTNDVGGWAITLNSPVISSTAVTFRIEVSENFAFKHAGFASYTSATIPGTSPFPGIPVGDSLQVNGSVTAVPEPSTYAMLLGGVGMLTLLRRRRSM